jgi:dimethylamine monooxygenase subunit A
MTLGFSVDGLLPKARGGGQLRMGLVKLEERDWRDPAPDLAARAEGFAQWPQGVQLTPEVDAPGRELAAMLGTDGALPEAALATHEDLCLLTRREGEEVYRLIGAAVAWPSDWHPSEKIGLPLRALHAPIAGYEEQLATGVDRFMETLRPGPIYGRCNWFIAPPESAAGLPTSRLPRPSPMSRRRMQARPCSCAPNARPCGVSRRRARSCLASGFMSNRLASSPPPISPCWARRCKRW